MGHIIEKEVIRPGTYWYRDESSGEPRKLVVTPELCRYWHEQGNAMLSGGLTVPVPVEHDFNAHPMTPAEKLKNNGGWVTGYKLKGDALFSEVDITDPEIARKLPSIRWTSPWINSFTDGQGKEWRNVISHLALTTRPRIINQEPFGSVAAALSMAAEVPLPQGKDGFHLCRAGLLDTDGLPKYPMAFSMWSGGTPVDAAFAWSPQARAKALETRKRNAATRKSGGVVQPTVRQRRPGAPKPPPVNANVNRAEYGHSHAAHSHSHALFHGGQGKGAHPTLEASAKMALKLSSKAEEHARGGNYGEAATHHHHAAHHHVVAAKQHRAAGNHEMAHKHAEAANAHFKASKAHAEAHSGGVAMATDAKGHEHGEHGRFASKGGGKEPERIHSHDVNQHHHLQHRGKRLKGKEAVTHLAIRGIEAKHKWFGSDAGEGIVHSAHDHETTIGKLKEHGYEHTHTSQDEDGEHREVLSHPKTGHKITVMHHKDKGGSRLAVSDESKPGRRTGRAMSISLGPDGKPFPPKGKSRGKPDMAPEDDEDTDGLDDDMEEGDEDEGDTGGDEDNIDLPPIGSPEGDVSMTELLCDLLGALGIPMQPSGDEQQFRRDLYNAAMTKIHELTAKGQGAGQQPNRANPPGQPPNNPQKPGQGGNPLITQEQQPMFMSLEDINKLDEPLRSVALSMHAETQRARADADANKKRLDVLNAKTLADATAARAKKVALLGRLAPRAKANLDAMLALPAMALSIGEAGEVVDPMAATLQVLEAGLADMPRLLTTDASALAMQPQPTDETMLNEARVNEIADGMARAMGCPPEPAGK